MPLGPAVAVLFALAGWAPPALLAPPRANSEPQDAANTDRARANTTNHTNRTNRTNRTHHNDPDRSFTDGTAPVLYPEPAPPYEPEPAATPADDPAAETEVVRGPRVLTTLYGHRPDEQKHFEARRLPVTFTPDLQVRARVGAVSEFTLDREGAQYIEGIESGGRIRWRPVLGLGRQQQVQIVGMIDAVNGRWSPRTAARPEVQQIIDEGQPPIATDIRYVDPRELYVQWTSPFGQLRAGQMSFTWGQGLVANDGNNMDRFGDLRFGNDGDGSLVERILFGTKPLARVGGPGKDIIVALGADLVYRDANADLREGDLAGQGLMVVRWQPEHRPDNWLGTYAAYRRQRSADDGDAYPDDDDLEVGVLDFAGQGALEGSEGLALIGAFEAAAIMGRTTFASGDSESHRVLQAGGAVRGFFGRPESWLAGFDAGFASGDANPDDDQINDFSAAPGYTAGLILFQYYQGWQSARSQILAEDPELLGVPPNGTQYIPTGGTVTNAVFLHPKLRWAWQEHFEVWGGPLVAASAVPLVDPFVSRLEGGDVVNSLGGRPDARSLGTELDLGIRSRYELLGMWMQAGLQTAVFFPGPAFVHGDRGIDGAVFGMWLRAEVRY